eukprot:GHVS01036675.1.p1 GENE.GHVS01036675.1~~GHVS01036675.1.p1  ORF type:complete len:609 (+),score=115.47 GHVS01036675.1:95-1921(+)
MASEDPPTASCPSLSSPPSTQWTPPFLQLLPTVQNYPWGCLGEDSLVAELYGNGRKLAFPNKQKKDVVALVDKNKEYAELWMGMHASGMSRVMCARNRYGKNTHEQTCLSGDLSTATHSQQQQTQESTTTGCCLCEEHEGQPLDVFLHKMSVAENQSSSCPPRCHQTALPPSSSGCFADSWRCGYFPCYLFKVLSIRCPLSLQAHPDKQTAERLHREQPAIYKDDNHKPEMAIALKESEAFCGFRKFWQFAFFFREVEELREVVGGRAFIDKYQPILQRFADFPPTVVVAEHEDWIISGTTDAIREAFLNILRCDNDIMQKNIISVISRITTESSAASTTKQCPTDSSMQLLSDCYDLFMRLHKSFPSDAGVFSVFLLQHHRMAPGQAIFIGPNLLHAYISGCCIEVMAASDNVVRGGLTGKHKDIDLLSRMLFFDQERGAGATFVEPVQLFRDRQPGQQQYVVSATASTTPSPSSIPSPSHTASVQLYKPPDSISEFRVLSIRISPGSSLSRCCLGGSAGPTTCLVVEGTVLVGEGGECGGEILCGSSVEGRTVCHVCEEKEDVAMFSKGQSFMVRAGAIVWMKNSIEATGGTFKDACIFAAAPNQP